MKFLNANALMGYSEEFYALTESQLVEIVFRFRLGALSAKAVFKDVETPREVADYQLAPSSCVVIHRAVRGGDADLVIGTEMRGREIHLLGAGEPKIKHIAPLVD